MKKSIIIAINIILLLIYFSPACYFYLSIQYLRSRFKRLKPEYRLLEWHDESHQSLELNGLKTLLQKGEDRTVKVYIEDKEVEGASLRARINKMVLPSIDLIDIDGDGLDELHFTNYRTETPLLDFYRENGELKYRFRETDKSSFLGRHYNSFRSDFRGHELTAGLFLMGGLIALAVHLVILAAVFVVRKIFFGG